MRKIWGSLEIPLLSLIKVEAELLLLLITLLNVGIFSAEVFDSPTFKSRRPCVGSIKTYQVKYLLTPSGAQEVTMSVRL